MNEPTIDEQIVALSECTNEYTPTNRAILASLERLKRLDSQPVPVEPSNVAMTLFGNRNLTHVADYIDTLQSELKRVTEERDNATTLLKQWKEEGNHLFCQTCDSCGIDDCCPPNQCWQTRAEAAESLNKRLVDAIRNLRDVKGRHNTEIATTRLFELLKEVK